MDPSRATWRKSTRSQANGNCVEVADLVEAVGVRDSKDKSGPVLSFCPEGWKSFIASVKTGSIGHD